MAVDYVGFLFALIVTAGGIAGYVKAQSIPSLAAGLVFGILLAIGAYQTSINTGNIILSLGTCFFVVTLMGLRCYITGKLVPSGVISILALSNIFRLSHRFMMYQADKDE